MKFVFYANTDWYLYNFRLSTALRLKAEGHDVVMLSPPGEFGERFSAHELRWIQLTMDRASLNPFREAQTISALTRILRAERPDLLHNFTVKCAIYGALAARAARVPAVVNAVAGMGYVFASDAMLARTLRPMVKLLMRGTLGGKQSRLILQNPDDADAFVRARLVPQQHIRVIRSSGVNLERFLPVEAISGPRPLRVLMAARLLWEKGIGEFIEAARMLRAQGRNIEFVIAGSPDPGNPRSASREQAEGWVAEGLVDWRGHVDDMPTLMRSMDVIALPSYYREGVPKSLIEAAACGLAVVTTNLPGCREVVSEDGVDGLHVEPRCARSLAERLAMLDDDRVLVRRLGDEARRKAMEHFDEQMVIRRTIEVYDELLPSRGVPNRAAA
ncbi:glycosyltransferase family 4 protein [Noviluteimonas gilva]|uniref:Glycosyltransferase n=1 Tax=Noviluteimonas gilva TaxID=2682097 RepID=A0A7C9HUK5_9GAMM|nr:glycosyltransferase family 4 protein [Lysobacter gilvus]MUV15131.1 glycosyltransferase [Lysobacter gilvus]